MGRPDLHAILSEGFVLLRGLAEGLQLGQHVLAVQQRLLPRVCRLLRGRQPLLQRLQQAHLVLCTT